MKPAKCYICDSPGATVEAEANHAPVLVCLSCFFYETGEGELEPAQAPGPPHYDDSGKRLTDCCAALSTFDEFGQLYCKACYQAVPNGQGDGTEVKP